MPPLQGPRRYLCPELRPSLPASLQASPPTPTTSEGGHVMPPPVPPSSAAAVASAAAGVGRKGRLAQAFGKMTVACPTQVRTGGLGGNSFARQAHHSDIHSYPIDTRVRRLHCGQAGGRGTGRGAWGVRGRVCGATDVFSDRVAGPSERRRRKEMNIYRGRRKRNRESEALY